jgi:hypothetical protein
VTRTAEQVIAAILVPGDRRAEPAAEAIGQGSVRPVDTLIGEEPLERAVRATADWIWVIDGGGRPRPDALERLLEASSTDPACAVAAGLVVDEAGRTPIELLVPAGTEGDTEAVLRLAQARLLPIRNATFAHTLVRRDALVQHGPPDRRRYGRYAAIEWTARVLRDQAATGLFVPASVISREPPRPRPADLPAVMRTARTSTCTRGETVRQLAAVVRRSRRSD